jgi:hypothetical protein
MRLFALLFVFYFYQIDGLTRTYQNCAYLANNYNFQIYWTVSGTSINIALTAESNGYIASGLSIDGSMDGGGGNQFGDGWLVISSLSYFQKLSNSLRFFRILKC